MLSLAFEREVEGGCRFLTFAKGKVGRAVEGEGTVPKGMVWFIKSSKALVDFFGREEIRKVLDGE